MASLSEHHEKIQSAIDAAEADGFYVEALSCCCGDGLRIRDPKKKYQDDEMEYFHVG
jgi:hypothetical protein